jgi:hypothetical protein
MSKVKLNEIVDCMNEAPSGSVVALKDYVSEDGTVKTVQGQIGVSYDAMKQNAICELKEAIEADTFEPMTVTGQAWENADGTFATRKSKDRKLVKFCEDYTKEQVTAFAKEILASWENAKPRENNKVQLTEKADGISFNTETLNFNFSLVVWNEYYKKDLTAKEQAGKEVKISASHPDTVVKKKIRAMFEKKYKAFTIAQGKFASLSIGGTTFESDNIII